MDENDELASKLMEHVSVAGSKVAGNAETGGLIEGLLAEPRTHCLNVTACCEHHFVVVSPVRGFLAGYLFA